MIRHFRVAGDFAEGRARAGCRRKKEGRPERRPYIDSRTNMRRKQKEERRLRLSSFICSRTLEANAQAELNPAATLRAIGRNQFLADNAEGRRVLQIHGRLEEINVVENVKEIG